MVTHSHYDTEDIPPAGTEIDLYQQARQAVDQAPAKAQALIDQAGGILESMYNAAAAAGDNDSMLAINAVWERSQQIVTQVIQQAQALAGADVAIDILQQQRETIAEELGELIEAIEAVDSDNPRVDGLIKNLRQSIDEIENEWATEVVYQSFYKNLVPIVKQVNPHANAYKRVDWFLQLLTDDVRMTAVQRQIIAQFFETMGN